MTRKTLNPLPSSSAEDLRRSGFADDVAYYLTLHPRQLPSRYLYDALGSALFGAICHLPWYNITRTEMRLLHAHGRAVFARLQPVSTITELGAGSGAKLRLLLESAAMQGRGLNVHLIDVSSTALTSAAQALIGLDDLDVVTHQASYEKGLASMAAAPRAAGRMLVLFLGSNIGNFDPPGAEALIRDVRSALIADDALLLGADLVKPERELLRAYDDPLGVTAAFNRNLLVRINRELGGDFNLDAYAHRAVWNPHESRVEMHLVAVRPQRVRIPAAGLEIDMGAGETIWTESSYKYQPQQIVHLLERAGFRRMDQWIDESDRFALTLVRAA